MMATALIIDDNEMNLETLRVLLKREGMDVISLLNPTDLQRSVEDIDDVQIVFLDLEFPNHSGMQVIEVARDLPQLQGVPIIAYSVHISEMSEVRAAGFDGFVGKPINVHQFPAHLRRILNGDAVWDSGQ